jgi:tetratricopeptide (TPR) repeat protein
MSRPNLIIIIMIILVSCKEKPSETTFPVVEKPLVTGLDGKEYFSPLFTTEKLAELEKNLNDALINFKKEKSEENYIWYGRRLAYLYRLDEAISVFSEGIEKYPASYKLLRHRGHRYISMRKYDLAINDLEKAAELSKDKPVEIEPDGIPNKINQPLSNSHFNIYYHLGLAYYLMGRNTEAQKAYENCMKYSDNNDLRIATADWMYMNMQRSGKVKEADEFIKTIDTEKEVVENDSYLQRIKLYKGESDVNDILNISSSDSEMELKLATQGYGVANWYLQNKDTVKSKEIFSEVLKGSSFTAFGFLASEADLFRLNSIQKNKY